MIVQLVVATGNREGQVIPITGEKFIIGRAEDCHMRPQSELISRYHCAILVGEKVVVRDLGSTNGVRLNGEKINAEQVICNGDKLTVAPLEFYLHIDAEMETGLTHGDAMQGDDGSDRKQSDNGEDTETGQVSCSTVLLNHLKTLNQEVHVEPQQFAPNPLKKIL